MLRNILLCFFLVLNCVPVAVSEDGRASAVARLSADLKYLSSDELAGRGVGSEGIDQAGEFIAERFQSLGLRTDSFDGSPFQDFTIPGPSELGLKENNRLKISGVPGLDDLKLGEDFTAVSLGSNGSFSGELVFAGYGITAPNLQYDDYAGLDVAGKVVVVLRKEPGQNDPNSKFDGIKPSQFVFYSTKELNAVYHQAAAMILVNDRVSSPTMVGETLPNVADAGKAATGEQIPTLFCTRSVVDRILRATTDTDLAALEAAIDQTGSPASRLLNGARAEGQTEIVESQVPVRNVVGFLPGAGDLASQTMVIGAHYDHVGMGGVGSLAPGTIEVHNGADDNASGTTALLEVARRLSQFNAEPRRSIIFIAFTGEESGLLGSKYYCRNPRWPLEETVAMLNMDMVGRLAGNLLTVYGTGTAQEFDDLVDRTAPTAGLAIDKQPAGFGPSDHSSFYELGIPVFHFFTGLHNDYHRPSDDFDKVNIQGMSKVVDLVVSIAQEISTFDIRPTLIKSSAVAHIGRGQPAQRKVVLGVRLDAASTDAVIAEVLPGSAASKAGMHSGDRVVQLANIPIDSIESLQAALAKQKPGEKVKVLVHRNGAELELDVEL